MTRLRKPDVEALMAAVDTDLLPDALSAALRQVLDVDGFDGDWGALVALAAERGGWSAVRRHQVVEGDRAALAELAVELNERREL